MSRRSRTSNQPTRLLQRKRLVLVLGIAAGLAILGGIAYAIQYSRQAPSLLEQARQAATERQYDASTRLYGEYLRFRPKDAEAYAELGGVYDDFARASLSRRKDADALWAKAIEHYLAALGFRNDLHEERKKLAKLYQVLGKTGEMEQHVRVLVANDSTKNDPELYVMLAQATPESKRDEKMKFMRQAIATGKADADIYRSLASYLKREVAKDKPAAHGEADELMRELVKERPKDLKARLARAKFLADFNRMRDCRAEIQGASEPIPGGADDVEVGLMQADTQAIDTVPLAQSIIEAALKTHPDNPLLKMGLAEILVRRGEREKARGLLKELAVSLPATDAVLLDVGDRAIDLGDFDAEKVAADKLKSVPDLEPLTSYLDGRTKLARGAWPEAIPLLNQGLAALEVNRRVTRRTHLIFKAYKALGEAHAQGRNLKQELDAFHRAAKLDEANVPARLRWVESLIKSGEAELAKPHLRGLAPTSPAARAMLAKLLLSEELRKPVAAQRSWSGFWDVAGKAPFPPEIAPIASDALLAEGKRGDAEALLRDATKTSASTAVFVRLATIAAAKSVDEALNVLTEADAKLGPTADVQLARALLLARKQPVPSAEIAALADVPKLTGDANRLRSSLGELLMALGKTNEGLDLLRAAVAERPYDLESRLALLDWGTTNRESTLANDMLAQIRAIDGSDGAATCYAEVAAKLMGLPKPTVLQANAMNEALADAEKKRPNWAAIPRLRGTIAERGGRTDEALEQYQLAVERGDRGSVLIRKTIGLLIERGQYAKALQLMAEVERSGGLPADLERKYRLMESMAKDDKDRALAWAESDAVTGSRNYQDHVVRALVLAQYGRLDGAKAAFERARGLAPEAPEISVNQIRVLRASGASKEQLAEEVKKAEAELAKLKPENPAAVPLAIAELNELIENFDAAEKAYRQAATLGRNDPIPAKRLLDFYLGRSNPTAALKFLVDLAADPNAKTETVRWAKRMRAGMLVDGPQGFREIPAAVALLDENLADRPSLDDERAKAFVQTRDPFQRTAAMLSIEKLRTRGPMSADQLFQFALLQQQAGKVAEAEAAMIEATRSGLLANPTHLALLARLQLERGKRSEARATVERLNVLAPKTVLARFEEARLIAKDEPAKATAIVLGIPVTGDAAAKATARARMLEEIGCPGEAEKIVREQLQSKESPETSHMPLVEFLIRQKRTEDAATLALEQQRAKVNCPAIATARLLTAAIAANPTFSSESWPKKLDEIDRFLSGTLGLNRESGELNLAMAEYAGARGRYDESLSLYRKAIERLPSKELQAVCRNNSAVLAVLLKPENAAASLNALAEAYDVLGPQPYLLDSRAVVQLTLGDAEKAKVDLLAAIAVQPSAAKWFHLARVYDRLKDPVERDAALVSAKQLGLTKASLHPLEATEYERMVK